MIDRREKGKRLLSYYTNLPLNKPEMINFGLTHFCNYRCSICNTREDNPRRDEEIDVNVLKKTIAEIGEWGDIGVSFAGGEPLIRKKDLLESLREAQKHDLTTYVTTNASKIDKETASSLIEAEVDFISLSLEATDKEVNDSIRNTGSYEDVLRAINVFKDLKNKRDHETKIGITTVVTNNNLEELEKIHDLVVSKDLYEVNYNPYVPDNSFMGNVDYENDEFWIPEERIEKLKEVTDKLLQIKRSEKGRIGTSDFILENMVDYFSQKEGFKKGKCLAGQSYMYIKPNGEVDVCGKGPSFDSSPMNVKEKSIKEIWRSLNFFITRLKIKNCKRPCLMLCFPKVSLDSFIRDVIE